MESKSTSRRSAVHTINQSSLTLLRAYEPGKTQWDWRMRHVRALNASLPQTTLPNERSFSTAIGTMLYSWASYADAYRAQFDSCIGNDGVLGYAWAAQGKAIIDLLNGPTGDLDAGTIDCLVRTIATDNGVTEEL